MKNFRSLLFSSAIVLGMGWAFTPLHAQDAAKKPVVIVIRHATDADRVTKAEPRHGEADEMNPNLLPMWPSIAWRKQTGETATVQSTWPDYARAFILIKPDGTQGDMVGTVRVSSHGLGGMWKTGGGHLSGTGKTPYGEDQAISLGMNLDKFLADHNFAPIKRAITMDPRNDAATANPFDTLWPYLKDKTDVDYYLVEYQAGKEDRFEGLMKLIAEDKVLPDGGAGSTIISWTGEGMSGEKGVVAKLLEKYRGKPYADWMNKGLMRRCNDMYIFSGPTDGNGTAQWWYFNYAANKDKGETLFELKEEHPSPAKF